MKLICIKECPHRHSPSETLTLTLTPWTATLHGAAKRYWCPAGAGGRRRVCVFVVRPGDKFALCCLICGWRPPCYCLPPESSLQLDFNLCIMSQEWETKQKQKQKLNRNGERVPEQNRNRKLQTICAPDSHPLHPLPTRYTRFVRRIPQ